MTSFVINFWCLFTIVPIDHIIRNMENKAKSLKPEMSELIGKLTTKAA
jgi:hypothetical protein